MNCQILCVAVAGLFLVAPALAQAQQPEAETRRAIGTSAKDSEKAALSGETAPETPQPNEEELFQKFEETLTGAKLTGRFTVVGKAGPAKEETYEIRSVKKIEKGDYWLFLARIKYGKNDVTLPMPLEVKWAGDTPVITLSETTIPALGTFSARVVIHNDWYAGTWIHGKAGGHMFGTITREAEE